MAEVNQAVVDEILASAEADTPEGKLEKLEKEVETLKGSIKRLLLDIREMMNNLENPFQNLQTLTEVAGRPQAPQIQVVPAPIPEPKPEEKEEKEEEKVEEPKPEEKSEDVKSDPETEPAPQATQPEAKPAELAQTGGSDMGVVVEEERKDVRKEVVEKVGVGGVAVTKYDIMALYKLMNWVRGMLEKYDGESLKLMLEIFSVAGYISEEAKEFVCMLAELISMNNGFEDMLLELYRLHKIMNPDDTSMDSQLLSLILEKKL